MAAIGSLVFCTDCGNLLDPNPTRQKYIMCDVCGTQNRDTSINTIVTASKPSAFPSTLRSRLKSSVQQVSESDVQKYATIQHTCEKCGNEKVQYYTQQLRSADEGTTVFYTCPKCNHRWKTDN